MSGGLVYYPGEVKTFQTYAAAAGCFDRPGIVVKVENSTATAPRVTKVAASGDIPFGICVQDTYNQDKTVLHSGNGVGIVTDGTAMVAVEAGTFLLGAIVTVADTTDGYGRQAHYTSGCMIGVCEEYKVIATGDYSDGTDQVAVRLKLGESEVY